jgi:hypothetical protein
VSFVDDFLWEIRFWMFTIEWVRLVFLGEKYFGKNESCWNFHFPELKNDVFLIHLLKKKTIKSYFNPKNSKSLSKHLK